MRPLTRAEADPTPVRGQRPAQQLTDPGRPVDLPAPASPESGVEFGFGSVRVHAAAPAGASTALAYPQAAQSPRGLAPAAPASPVPLTALDRFRQAMRRRFGVLRVRVGTQAEQEASITPRSGVPAGGIHIPNWRSWQPSDQDLDLIEEAFDDVGWAFEGVPQVDEIVFFETAYELTAAGVATPMTDVGASFGAGQLTIFRSLTTDNAPLPFARSNAADTYPGRPVAGVGSRGSSPGAPLPIPTHEENVRRTVAHELGHGLAEAALGGANPLAATDPKMIEDYERAVGWVGGQLFDMGVPAVRTAIRNGTPPPAQYRITANDWNHPQWIEQPLSHYSVSGGPTEDFAETAMAYVYAPNLLLARSPRRFEFLRDRRQRWRPALVVPRRLGDFPLPTGANRPV